ncbi:MAG: LacI family DNA-binding transcriptional regulator [Trueperaceae bacterium]|nr:LacI family DNA-binding transcriptional regulator [Trueperaceae bacterium]
MGVKGSGDKRGTEGGSPSRLTLKDIAAELGIAPSTVSNAYNRPDQLSESLRKKILDTAARLGYTGPDPAARSLRRGVSNVIGVAFAGPLSYAFTDPAAAQFIEGIAREVESAGYALMLMGTPDEDEGVLPITTANVDGLVVQCLAEDDPVLEAALARRLPTVMVDNSGAAGYLQVSIDDEGGARAAAEHLIARGHTQLGIVAMEFGLDAVGGLAGAERQAQVSYVSVRARLDGYRAAVEAAGLTWDGNVSVYECGDNRPIDGEEAAAALLAQQPRPTALLAMSDQLAFGALSYLKDEGIAVPEEVAVVGFDDQPAAAHSTPPLTTVHQPSVEKGRQAGRLLLAQLRGESPPPSVKLPTRLIVRESG